MPIARHFADLGRGDGLGLSLRRRDISGADYWTTLSGYNKIAHDAGTPVTAESIYQSKALAVRIFRNFYQLNATVDVTRDGTPSTLENLTAEDDGRERSNDVSIILSESLPEGVLRGILDVNLRIVEMHIGAVEDPANIIGYGLSEVLPAFWAYMPNSSPVQAEVGLWSYTDEDTFYTYEYAYTTLGGAHWVAEARANGATSQSVDVANLTASATDIGRGLSATVTITDLEYYTYA